MQIPERLLQSEQFQAGQAVAFLQVLKLINTAMGDEVDGKLLRLATDIALLADRVGK